MDFTWVYENAAIARMNGTDPKVVVGRRLLELFPGHRGSSFFEAYQQVAETGESRVLEAPYYGDSNPHRAGSERPWLRWGRTLRFSLRILPNAQAGRGGACSREGKRRASQGIRRARQPRQDHFLAVLSHELRTPLTPVVMGVSMLQDDPNLAPKVRETLEMIHRNIQMEARLIDDLLDVSRIAREDRT